LGLANSPIWEKKKKLNFYTLKGLYELKKFRFLKFILVKVIYYKNHEYLP